MSGHSPDPPRQEWHRGDYTITTDRARIDIDVVHAYLTRSYWAEGIPRDVVARAIAGALNFGIHVGDAPQASPGVDPTTQSSADLQSARVVAGDPSQSPSALAAANTTQVGGARIITDCATFAYVADVFVLEEHRGQGLGIWLMECIVAHPSLQGLRRWMLGTRDAHTLYDKTGWTRIDPTDGRWMERAFPDLYNR